MVNIRSTSGQHRFTEVNNCQHASSINKRIFNAWLACHTQEEIAEREGMPQRTVADVIAEMAELPKSLKPAAEHLTDFDVPTLNHMLTTS
jgi:hypothetical protein